LLTLRAENLEEHDNPLLIIVPPKYISALLKLHEKLEGKNIEWALSGKLGEALRTVRVEPDFIEIVASKDAAYQIHDTVAEFNVQPIAYLVQQLPRNASIQGVEYPVYFRSHYFEFDIDTVKVKVYGDLQYKVGDWDWGDTFQFNPDTVYVVGKKTSVVPLVVKHELYTSLGWVDKAENINKVFATRAKILHRLDKH
jgi:hypothetical protein